MTKQDIEVSAKKLIKEVFMKILDEAYPVSDLIQAGFAALHLLCAKIRPPYFVDIVCKVNLLYTMKIPSNCFFTGVYEYFSETERNRTHFCTRITCS